MSDQQVNTQGTSNGSRANNMVPVSSCCGSSAAKIAVFACICVCWTAFDQLVKAFINNGVNKVGQQLSDPILGLFTPRLVYNTGGAWSIFSNSTIALGVFSVVMCSILVAFFFVHRKSMSWAEVIGLALVVAGGVGNAIDRFVLGHVVDFIDLTFIDFPVFNIADIGVTCGIVLFLIACFIRFWREDAGQDASQDSEKAQR